MNQTKPYDVVILGGGIAGLSAADAVLQRGKTCLLIDTAKPGSGASGAPAMLINPATGRRAKKAWEADACYKSIRNFLKRVQQYSSKPFFDENGVLRPALTQNLASDFERSIHKYNWPQGWIEWLPAGAFQSSFPTIAPNYGGLIIRKASTVHGSMFIEEAADYLQKNGLHLKTGQRPEIHRNDNIWQLRLNGAETFRTAVLIDTTGYRLAESPRWRFLNLHPVKGQTATFFFDEPLDLHHSISGLGYIAWTKHHPKQITVGSTYEHEFDDTEPDQNGLIYLQKKLARTLPGLEEKSTGCKQWASVRISVPDKKPVIGEHPSQTGLYIIAALGSKGLLMGRYMAEYLVKHIFDGTHIDESISINRF